MISQKQNSEKNKPLVGIIANVLDPEHRSLVIDKLGPPINGRFFVPLPFAFKSAGGQAISGEVILLDVFSDEVSTVRGFAKGQEGLLAAVAYFHRLGTKIIAFTSATKRLAGKNGQKAKQQYPDITFTIGDNGTWLSGLKLINNCLRDIALKDKIVIMGAGFLGEAIISYLSAKQYKNIIVFSQQKLLNLPKSVRLINDFQEIGKGVKLFLSCTHKHRDELDIQEFQNIFAEQATIVDVAVPKGIGKRLYEALNPGINRYDAGDYFLPRLKYAFDPALLQFPAVGYWYGCFTEAIFLGLAWGKGQDLRALDLFKVVRESTDFVDALLSKDRVLIPVINFLDIHDIHKVVPMLLYEEKTV